MGAKGDTIGAAAVALGVNLGVGLVAGIAGTAVGAASGSVPAGAAVGGVTYVGGMTALALTQAEKHPRFAGGVMTIALGTGIGLVVAGAMAALGAGALAAQRPNRVPQEPSLPQIPPLRTNPARGVGDPNVIDARVVGYSSFGEPIFGR